MSDLILWPQFREFVRDPLFLKWGLVASFDSCARDSFSASVARAQSHSVEVLDCRSIVQKLPNRC
eukprot:6304246-Amphidinium_carterae.1